MNEGATETLAWEDRAPIVRFDGSDNLYVFWKRWMDENDTSDRGIFCNIKGASAAIFDPDRVTLVTVDQDEYRIEFDDLDPIFHAQVASDRRIHVVRKSDNYYSRGTIGPDPLFRRAKDPNVNASVG